MKNFIFCLLLAVNVEAKKSLKGQVAVVTGASSGIGLTAARELAKQGMHVVLAARRTTMLEAAVKEITAAGGSAVAKACDVANPIAVKKMFAFAEEQFGGVDFVFANAAIEGEHLRKSLEDQDDESIAQIHMVNSVGVLYTLKYAVKAFNKRGGGTIGFSSSIGALVPAYLNFTMFGFPPSSIMVYHSTKNAVDRIAMDAHSAYLDSNIKVYNFNIGCFFSELGARIGFSAVGADAAFNPVVPKIGNPVTIAQVIIAILDGTSKWKPGSAIMIDNDVTVDSHHFYNDMYGADRKNPYPLWRHTPAEFKKLGVTFDVKGEPYKWKDEL